MEIDEIEELLETSLNTFTSFENKTQSTDFLLSCLFKGRKTVRKLAKEHEGLADVIELFEDPNERENLEIALAELAVKHGRTDDRIARLSLEQIAAHTQMDYSQSIVEQRALRITSVIRSFKRQNPHPRFIDLSQLHALTSLPEQRRFYLFLLRPTIENKVQIRGSTEDDNLLEGINSEIASTIPPPLKILHIDSTNLSEAYLALIANMDVIIFNDDRDIPDKFRDMRLYLWTEHDKNKLLNVLKVKTELVLVLDYKFKYNLVDDQYEYGQSPAILFIRHLLEAAPKLKLVVKVSIDFPIDDMEELCLGEDPKREIMIAKDTTPEAHRNMTPNVIRFSREKPQPKPGIFSGSKKKVSNCLGCNIL